MMKVFLLRNRFHAPQPLSGRNAHSLLRAVLLPVLIVCALLGYGMMPLRSAPATAEVPVYEGILRLHIPANSDSPADQAVKIAVRDAVLPLFSQAESYEDACTFLLAHGKAIQQVCEDTLRAHGMTYGAQLQLGVTRLPDRTYDGVLFPAGDYDVLCIVLGNGGGQNWWCVLFPPLCIVTPDGAPADLENLEFESDVLTWLKAALTRG